MGTNRVAWHRVLWRVIEGPLALMFWCGVGFLFCRGVVVTWHSIWGSLAEDAFLVTVGVGLVVASLALTYRAIACTVEEWRIARRELEDEARAN